MSIAKQCRAFILCSVLFLLPVSSQAAPYQADVAGGASPSTINRSYASPSMARSPVSAGPNDVSAQFTAPDGQVVTVTVKSPVATRTYNAPAIGPGQDPTAYFKKQISDAGSGASLVIPKGKYDFLGIDCTDLKDAHYNHQYIYVYSVHDMVIDGQGSVLNFASDCSGIFFNAAVRVTLKNFTINWPNLHVAAVATVVAVHGDARAGYSYDLQVPSANGITGFSVVTAWDSVHDYWSLTKPHDEIYYASSYGFSPAGFAGNVPSHGLQLAVGESLLVRNPGKSSAITVWNSQDVTIDGVKILAAPGMGFMIAYGRGIHIANSSVDRAPGRPISTTTDAIHFANHSGDIIIENNTFAYQGDDGINIHTGMYRVPPCASPAVDCQFPLAFSANPGDTIGLFDQAMNFVGTQIASCTNGACAVGVSPLAATGGYLTDLTETPARYVIRNNRFAYNRARGALLQSPYGLVQGNTFVGQSLFALYFVASSYWGEGPGAQDVLVVDNTISSCGNGGGWGAVTVGVENNGGLIYAAASGPVAASPVPAVHQNLTFFHNSIRNVPGPAFYISSASNVDIHDNGLTGTNMYSVGSRPNRNAQIAIYDASNVTVSGNASVLSGTSQPVIIDGSDSNISAR